MHLAYWSIAQTKDRETEASGLGWELFKNYLIAKEKWKPDYFLYENNVSADWKIKAQIKHEFGVTDAEQIDMFTDDTGVRYTEINSALLSAQNRARFYVTNFGDIEQPKDRGILLKDILENKCEMQTTEPVRPFVIRDKARTLIAGYAMAGARNLRKDIESNGFLGSQGVIEPIRVGSMPRPNSEISESQTLNTMANENYMVSANGKKYPIYEVKDGKITIKGKQYPIRLVDGYYIIRKLTVRECMRLQTVPEWYVFPVSDSQAYKMLGNGWTVEVIKHLLSHIPNIQNEEVEVLSMYDGMACGMIALKEMGVNVVKYTAYEIDKYAIQTATYNFPEIIEKGDAFQVREDGWQP